MLSCDACGGRCYSDNRMDNPPEFKPIPVSISSLQD